MKEFRRFLRNESGFGAIQAGMMLGFVTAALVLGMLLAVSAGTAVAVL